ncbi:uncharacterized protein LOC143914728 [Arctopsyche grandis]|uniref:uncharacterized protein LOC143914728 n=1 Tax=Arctopsyche grandis TaxID=121162 RepID=UPI00406D9737
MLGSELSSLKNPGCGCPDVEHLRTRPGLGSAFTSTSTLPSPYCQSSIVNRHSLTQSSCRFSVSADRDAYAHLTVMPVRAEITGYGGEGRGGGGVAPPVRIPRFQISSDGRWEPLRRKRKQSAVAEVYNCRSVECRSAEM